MENVSCCISQNCSFVSFDFIEFLNEQHLKSFFFLTLSNFAGIY